MLKFSFLTKKQANAYEKSIKNEPIFTKNGITYTTVSECLCLGRAKYIPVKVTSMTNEAEMTTKYKVEFAGLHTQSDVYEEALIDMIGLLASELLKYK